MIVNAVGGVRESTPKEDIELAKFQPEEKIDILIKSLIKKEIITEDEIKNATN